MTFTERISEDLKSALKAGDQVRLTTIRSIRASLIELAKRGSGTVSAEEEVGALLAAAKKRKEAIELYDKAGRKDLADLERAELAIIQQYLPPQMTREAAATIVDQIVAATGATGLKDIGKVMPAAMKEMKGKIDGSVVQELVKSRLGS